MKLTPAHLACLSPNVLKALRSSGCISGLDVAKANAVRTDFLKRTEEVDIRKSDDSRVEEKEEGAMSTQTAIYELARDINKRIKDPRERDEMLTRLHRAEQNNASKALHTFNDDRRGADKMPPLAQGSVGQLDRFNSPSDPNSHVGAVDQSIDHGQQSADTLAAVAAEMRKADPSLTQAKAVIKASSDPRVVAAQKRATDQTYIRGSKLYG
jgi:hypothetical protein